MKRSDLVIAVIISLLSCVASADLLSPAPGLNVLLSNGLGTASAGGLVEIASPTVSAFGERQDPSNWAEGKGAWAIYTLFEQDALTRSLGCFPTAAQVPVDMVHVAHENQQYHFLGHWKGKLAPGQTVTIKVSTCAGAGDQPFTQTVISYQYINRKTKLTHYTIGPDGVSYPSAHPTTTTSAYKVIWGGVSNTMGKPGVWTHVLTNTTRYPIEVYSVGVKVVLN